jgi:hypothetical protein
VTPPDLLTAEPLVAIDELRLRPWVSAKLLAGPLGRPEGEVAALARTWATQLRIADQPVFTLIESGDRVGVRLSTAMQTHLDAGLRWLPLSREAVQQSLVDYARWNGQIARRDVTALVDIAEVTATGWLTAMADEGLLVVGIRAGRYAHYIAPNRSN